MQSANFNKQASDRILYFDCLRIFATFGVMILHISGSNWIKTSVTSFEWHVFNFFDSIVRWSVPIFVMISGALFLSGNSSIGKIHKKNILKIITCFIFWSILYALVNMIQGANIKSTCVQIIQGHYHMWFLFMIVGLYLIVPFVKKMVESQTLIKYFLALSLIFTFIIPQGVQAITFADSSIGDVVNTIVKNINFYFTLGYVCYFVLGYYLSKVEIPKRIRRVIYILSILGFISTIVLTSFISVYTNEPQNALYGNFTINVMLESIGLFIFFKYNVGPIIISEKIQTIIIKMSKYSFGAYLVHAMVFEQLNNIWGLNTLTFNPIVSIIVIAIIVFAISFAISYVCNHIPFLNKYIV